MMNSGNGRLPQVAYFCMEYGLDSRLPIYAGGLGVLAGDFLKAASDLKLPVVGIGILWRNDYTEQFINEEGWPYDLYPNYDFDFVKDTGVSVKVQVAGKEVTCKVWSTSTAMLLYLLDAVWGSEKAGLPRLYRRLLGIAQEIVHRYRRRALLRALNINVDISLTEAAVLAGIERYVRKWRKYDFRMPGRLRAVRLYYDHTPVKRQ